MCEKDVVCMMHPNHPLFMVTWLAILKTGAIPSLLNTNLNGESLVHCIQVSKARLFLFDPEYTEQVKMAASNLNGVAVFGYGEGYTEQFPMITEEILAGFSSDDTDKNLLQVEGPEDPALLIYTRYKRKRAIPWYVADALFVNMIVVLQACQR